MSDECGTLRPFDRLTVAVSVVEPRLRPFGATLRAGAECGRECGVRNDE